MDLSVILPCYNESENIPLIVSRFKNVIPADIKVEVIFVNNGSEDNSEEVFRRQLSELDSDIFRLVDVPINVGYGNGILAGLSEARGKVLSWTHADMQTDPKDVFIGYDLYTDTNKEMIVIKGVRKNRRLLDELFTYGMGIISSALLGANLSDINAQPKVFSYKFYKEHLGKKAPKDFSLDLYLLFKAKKYHQVIEFPVFFLKREKGESKGGGTFKGKVRLIRRTLSYIVKLRKELEKGAGILK